MKIKALLYCTKAKPYLQVNRCVLPTEYDRYILDKEQCYSPFGEPLDKLNGKIVAECDYEVEKINVIDGAFTTHTLNEKELLNKSCLTFHQMFDYFADTFNYGYAIHIKNLHIFDEPRDLKEYDDVMANPLNKAPKNMMYAFKYFANLMNIQNQFQEYVLISTQPQEMCRIANKEQTILVRRNVLKEMLKNE